MSAGPDKTARSPPGLPTNDPVASTRQFEATADDRILMTNVSGDALEAPDRIFTLDEQEGISYALFREFALRERAFHSRSIGWPTELKQLPDIGPPLASARNSWSETQVVRRDDVLCHARVADGWARVSLAAANRDLLDPVERELRERLPRPPARPDDDPSTVMRFWNRGPVGARTSARRIAVPRWEEIRSNYPTGTVGELDSLMDGWQPEESGQLLLWHGPPGTGKTYALRALSWQWRRWCEPHYIVDPEIFFGDRPDYMLEVLLNEPEGEDELGLDARYPNSDPRSPRWRLLILEDTGEMLAADAKERTGQGLSRLLNVVDGLIGQGLRVLLLVTGNEPLRRFHPAISRAGRCASIAEFHAFSAEEARVWLANHGAGTNANLEGGTLADLYSALVGRRRRYEHAVGFA